MNSCELTASITALANIIAKNFDADQLNLISTILVQLGDTLATIVTNNEICSNTNSV